MNINKDIYIEVQKEKINNLNEENLVLQSIIIDKNQYISHLEEELSKYKEKENTESESEG